MRLKIVLNGEDNIFFPIEYNSILQSFIYTHLNSVLAQELHNTGYKYKNKRFKLFVFSRLFGAYKIVKTSIYFKKSISFFISSPVKEILESFAMKVVNEKFLKLGRNMLRLKSIEVLLPPLLSNNIRITMLSPMTVYTTIKKNKKIYTHYFNPLDKEFNEYIRLNMLKKYAAFRGNEDSMDMPFEISVKKVMSKDLHIVKFKDTIIKAWTGHYELKGEIKLIEFAYNTGLGVKNSEGFGMFEVKKT